MLDLNQLQLLAQMVDDMEIATERIEKAYADNDGESFQNYKNAILEVQKKIDDMVSTNNPGGNR